MAENMRPPVSHRLSVRRRALVWLAWWVLMMSLWVMVDDSLQFDELLAGAGAAALAALGAELATYQASVRFRLRPGWPLAAEVLRLPGQVACDTLTVFGALARMLTTGRPPEGGFAELPVDVPPGEAGRVLLTGVRSVAPNTFVLGIDDERGVLVVHRLVTEGGRR
jgi:multisubunit Na+/H+ antiporter MnhE subunit